MLKIRRPLGRLIFNMGIAIPGKTVFLIETAPCWRIYASTNGVVVGSGNGMSPIRRHVVTWIKHDLLSIESLGTSFCGISIKIHEFAFGKWRIATITSNAGILSIEHKGANFSEISFEKKKLFNEETEFQSVIRDIVAVLSRLQPV